MIRYGLLIGYMIALAVIASKDWYKALCMLLVLTVFSQRPDMPRYLFDIPGMSPWNLCFAIVLVFWVAQRHMGPARAAASHGASTIFMLYMLLIVVTGLVATIDARSASGNQFDAQGFFIDGVVNPFKYAFMGYLFFEGAVTRKRVTMGLLCVVGGDLIYGLMMFKTMGPRVFTINYIDARRLTDKLIGLYANDIAQVLAFAIWAALLIALVLRKRWMRRLAFFLAAITFPPFISLKSRAGYVGLLTSGVLLGALRYRIILILLPLGVGTVWLCMASVRDRFLMTGTPGEEITAGRMTELWPPVIRQIPQSPIWGHGRFGILRAHCYQVMVDEGIEVPLHPHNAYLEMLLDAGVLGMGICLAGMIGLTRASWGLSKMKDDPLVSTTGLVSLMAIATIMTVGLSGASFYPVQSTLPYICLWGAVMRMWTEIQHSRQNVPVAAAMHRRRPVPAPAGRGV